MQEHITALDELLRQAVLADSLVLLCLKSRKVYCGVISEIRGNHESAIAHVQIIPAFSIARNKDTLQFEKSTKTEYRAYHLKLAFERIRTLNAMIRDATILMRIFKVSFSRSTISDSNASKEVLRPLRQIIRKLITERKQLRRTLEPYGSPESFNIDEWVKVIPVTEIESASLYKDEDYDKWFSAVKPALPKPARYIGLVSRPKVVSIP